jgi:hypothetical protein
MTEETPKPRQVGEALYRAQCAEIEQSNVAAKKAAHEHTRAASAAAAREQRLAVQEAAQLKVLNARLDAKR